MPVQMVGVPSAWVLVSRVWGLLGFHTVTSPARMAVAAELRKPRAEMWVFWPQAELSTRQCWHPEVGGLW